MDKSLLLWIHQDWAHPWLDVLLGWISGRLTFSFPLLILFLLGFARRWGRDGVKLWLMLVVLIGAGDAFGNLLKHAIGAPRPCSEMLEIVRWPCADNTLGMPSNHALTFFAAAAFLGVALRWGSLTAALFLLAAAVGVSRIYLAKHYPSQVIAGASIGIALGMLAAWVGLKYLAFFQRVRPGARLQKASNDNE